MTTIWTQKVLPLALWMTQEGAERSGWPCVAMVASASTMQSDAAARTCRGRWKVGGKRARRERREEKEWEKKGENEGSR